MVKPPALAGLTIDVERPENADARWCLEGYFSDLDELLETGFDRRRTAHVDDAEITPPSGLLLVARREGRPVGCRALRIKGDGVGEVKRLWVKRDARGGGIARRILLCMELHARERGLTTLRLDTNRALGEAMALYSSCGYVEVERFNDEPYAHHWFSKDLGR